MYPLLSSLLSGLLLVVASGLPSLAAPSQEPTRGYVGTIAGAEAHDALVAVVVAPDGQAIAYVCSADDAWNQEHSRWYTGELTAQGALAATARDGKQLVGQVYGDTLSGTVGGLAFRAELVPEGTAGLYRGRVDDEVHAVIEAPDGRRVGGVWYASDGGWAWTWRFTPATMVDRAPGALRVQRPPEAPALAAPPAGPQPPPGQGQQFVFIELRSCVSAFDQCGNI
ncbi:MAG TPA: hypothetical protein VKZ60_16700 [Chloroflexota bacterium]|jgi:hypothetical protein|nr:hypothetical protein [Chloroflexota bacterium]